MHTHKTMNGNSSGYFWGHQHMLTTYISRVVQIGRGGVDVPKNDYTVMDAGTLFKTLGDSVTWSLTP